MELNIENRLTERNPSYEAAGVVLSQDRLRDGAEKLAAATELTGRAYIALAKSAVPKANEVRPVSVLSDWKPDQVTCLVASAVFDEVSLGRVQFHHRSIRSYLAACWADKQLATVPFHQVLTLFTASPFGAPVLIPSRRWAFCWLASINVRVREWVTTHFPEMFVFDGDPDAWDSPSADRAFISYMTRLEAGLRTKAKP